MNWKIKSFENLSLEELYDMLRLRVEVFVLEQKCFYQDLDNIDKSCYHLFGYEDDDELVACLRIIDGGADCDYVKIGRVVIDKKYRGQDLGYAMMKKALAYTKDILGILTVKIEAQEYAIGFYEKLGFKTCSDVFLLDDIPHVEMSIDLI